MDRTPRYVKFTGSFRDLKGRGYKFWKAFASNYRVYSKRPSGEWTCMLNVWQHLGGYVEVGDFLEFTYLLIEAMERGEHKTWKLSSKYLGVGDARIFINTTEGYLFVYKDGVEYSSQPNYYNTDLSLSDEEREERRNEYYKHWRELRVRSEMLAELECLMADGLIKVVPDTRKY